MGVAIGQIIVGLIESFFGRKLYWVFVALAGFAIGWVLAPAIFGGLATWALVLIGAVMGVVFALLSVKFMRFMVSVAGFFAFGPVTVLVVRWLGAEAVRGSVVWWIAFVLGGLVGFFVMLTLFNWALIVLTSLVGAGSAATGISHFVTNEPKWLQIVIFVVVFALGALFQARALRSRKRSFGTVRPAAVAR
jgi:hypothetical protein